MSVNRMFCGKASALHEYLIFSGGKVSCTEINKKINKTLTSMTLGKLLLYWVDIK